MAYNGGPMTEAMYYVLLVLMNSSRHGYSLMPAITKASHGRVNIGSGTIYGVLTRMQKDGLITISGRRNMYTITAMGKEALQNESDRLSALVDDGLVLKEGDRNESNFKIENK